MASFNEAWMLNKVTGEFFLTKNGFSQSITMANGPSQWRQGTCSDQKGNWVRYWFSGNRWFLEPQPSEEKWTPPLEGELLWLDPADYQMKLAWGELADCAAFEPEAALAPPASAGGRRAREPASRPGLAAVLGCLDCWCSVSAFPTPASACSSSVSCQVIVSFTWERGQVVRGAHQFKGFRHDRNLTLCQCHAFVLLGMVSICRVALLHVGSSAGYRVHLLSDGWSSPPLSLWLPWLSLPPRGGA